jgi:hypothetical protein
MKLELINFFTVSGAYEGIFTAFLEMNSRFKRLDEQIMDKPLFIFAMFLTILHVFTFIEIV